MIRVLEWIKEVLHPGCAEPAHGELEATRYKSKLHEHEQDRLNQEEVRRWKVSEDIKQRDAVVDKRIEALEQFAEQMRRKKNL